MEDEILIKYLRKNDRKAYSILFDKYFERLFTFAVRVVFREDVANDIVQEIFISLYEKSEILNYDLSLKSYLLIVCGIVVLIICGTVRWKTGV